MDKKQKSHRSFWVAFVLVHVLVVGLLGVGLWSFNRIGQERSGLVSGLSMLKFMR